MSPVQQSVLAAGEAGEHRPLIICLFAVFVVWPGSDPRLRSGLV